MAQYNPQSHFYTDPSKLKDATAGNLKDDAFGPIKDSETSKYRITSFVNSNDGVNPEVFAVVSGQLAILQQTGVGNENKLNLIIKNSSPSFSPIKIKYFIYRGINKADLIDTNNNIIAENANDPNQPAIIKRLWTVFKEFNSQATVFPANLIGYGIGTPETLLDNIFCKNVDFYCNMGEHLANFSGKLGFDIVLDYGDYILEKQEVLFNLDCAYAQTNEFVFDMADSRLTLTSDVKKKRYKEHIHQFLDAAAFWGSHINVGTITVKNSPNYQDVPTIYNLLKKYQTKNKIYIYIQGENNRSFGYYDVNPKRKIYGFEVNGEENITNGWPILIKETESDKELMLEYQIDGNVNKIQRDIQVSIKTFSSQDSFYTIKKQRNSALIWNKNVAVEYNMSVPNLVSIKIKDNKTLPEGLILDSSTGKITGIPTLTEVKTIVFERTLTNGDIQETSRTFYINAININLKFNFSPEKNISCSDFVFLDCAMKQNFPLPSYFNQVWIPNINISTDEGIDDNKLYWATYDKNRNISLDEIIDENAIIQNKVIFDEVKRVSETTTNFKKRRLFAAIIKNNSGNTQNFLNLNIDKVSSGFSAENKTSENYFLTLFNDNEYFFYKGTFKVGSKIINSISIFNDDLLFKRHSYLMLGLTEDDYNKLVIPVGADNIFFYLEEDTSFVVDNVKKFKVGFQCEDINGNIIYTMPPNDVVVYTIDGILFFSEEFSDYQEFFVQYPKSNAEFRLTQPYNGEFGFDWMRVGDTTDDDYPYDGNVGKLYNPDNTVVMNINQFTGDFKEDIKLFQKLEREYNMYPMQYSNDNKVKKCYVPSLSLYPSYVETSNGINLDKQEIFAPDYDLIVNRMAKISLIISRTEQPSKIFLEYLENDSLSVKITPVDPSISLDNIIPVKNKTEIELIVRSSKALDKDVYVKVKAQYGMLNKTIGLLKILKNNKSQRKAKKVLFMNIKTKINVDIKNPPLKPEAEFLKKYLRQSFITPIFEKLELDLSVSPLKNTFNSYYVREVEDKFVIIDSDDTISDFVDVSQFIVSQNVPGTNIKIKDKFNDHFICMFFDEPGYNKVSSTVHNALGGISNRSKSPKTMACYSGRSEPTASHEILHLLTLDHSFVAFEASSRCLYTYKPLRTNNLMDYIAKNDPEIRNSIWGWQSEIARRNSNDEP